ncbi:MAG: hypothetical protein LBT09_15255 [Planctomycetaceae bacterium]|nr:hypothetical protein [Planctomycetaceae bacterium]
MLRYGLTFLVIQVVLATMPAVILFAQPSGENAIAPPRLNNRSFANIKFPSGMLTTIGRSYSNALDKGLTGTVMIFEGVRKEEIRNAMGITETQAKEIETFRTAMQIHIVTKIPELIKRFDNTNENNRKSIQNDIETDIQKFVDKINSITTPAQQAKARELAFQATGGLNSPLVGKDTLDVLNLTNEQREKAELIIEQAKTERNKKIEELIKLIEERTAKKELTQEERNEFRKKREALFAEILAIGKKTGDRLKGFLDDQQRKKADDLIANAPDFLPKLPRANNAESPYIPNPDSWKPGQGVPDSEKDQRNTRKTFPRRKN